MNVTAVNRHLILLVGLPGKWEWCFVGVLLALETALFRQGARARQADYDEGVYLAAVDAVRHGQELGTDVFTAQPPGFYHALELGQTLLGSGQTGARLTIMAFALVGCLGAYLLGRSVGGPWMGALCSALVAVAPSYAAYAGRVSADLPATALLVLAIALAVRARVRPGGEGLWLAVGLLCGLAATIKLSAVSGAVPILILVWVSNPRRLRSLLLVAAAAGAVALGILLLHIGSLGAIWHGMVDYHEAARDSDGTGVSDNLRRMAKFPELRTGFGWLALAGLAAAAAVLSARRFRSVELAALGSWVLVTIAFLAWHRPLHDNHLVLLAAAVATAAGVALGTTLPTLPSPVRRTAVAAVAALLLAGYVQEHRRLVRNQIALPAELTWAVAQTRAHSSPDQLVASDRQIVPFLADRRVPGQLVDTAALRFASGFLSPAEVMEEIERNRVPVVVVSRAFRLQPGLLRQLEETFPHMVRRGTVTVYWRD